MQRGQVHRRVCRAGQPVRLPRQHHLQPVGPQPTPQLNPAGKTCGEPGAVSRHARFGERALPSPMVGTPRQRPIGVPAARAGLIECTPHTHRYQVTNTGLRHAMFLTRVHDRILQTRTRRTRRTEPRTPAQSRQHLPGRHRQPHSASRNSRLTRPWPPTSPGTRKSRSRSPNLTRSPGFVGPSSASRIAKMNTNRRP